MNLKQKTPYFSAITFFVATTLGLGVLAFKSKKKNEDFIKEFEQEKMLIVEDLKELSALYDNLEVVNQELQNEVDHFKNQIDSLQKVVKNSKIDKYSILRKYRGFVKNLKKERHVLLVQNDSLLKINDNLLRINDSIAGRLVSKNYRFKALVSERNALFTSNRELNSSLQKNSNKLIFYNTKGYGLKIRNTGRISVVNKIRKTNKIKVCTNVKASRGNIKENKRVYFKVYNPNKKLLGKLFNESHGPHKMTFSASEKFLYKNQQTQICSMIEVQKENLISGKYTVEVYSDFVLQDTYDFRLK